MITEEKDGDRFNPSILPQLPAYLGAARLSRNQQIDQNQVDRKPSDRKVHLRRRPPALLEKRHAGVARPARQPSTGCAPGNSAGDTAPTPAASPVTNTRDQIPLEGNSISATFWKLWLGVEAVTTDSKICFRPW